MTSAMTAAFFDRSHIEELIRLIIVPAFLFDKVNMFLATRQGAQKLFGSA